MIRGLNIILLVDMGFVYKMKKNKKNKIVFFIVLTFKIYIYLNIQDQ